MKQTQKKKSLKKRIRDLNRSIALTTEPELLTAKQSQLEKLKIRKRLAIKNPKLYERYKPVKFFGEPYIERQKLERKLKKILRQISEEGETPGLLTQKSAFQADLDYVKHYPLNSKYVALFAQDSGDSIKYREVMQEHVRKIIAKKQQKKLEILNSERDFDCTKHDAFFIDSEEKTTPFSKPGPAPRARAEPPLKKRPRLPPRLERAVTDTSQKVHFKYE